MHNSHANANYAFHALKKDSKQECNFFS